MSTLPVALPPEIEQRTLPEMFRFQARRNPDRLALIASDATGAERRLTYSQLIERAERFAQGLAATGVRAGDRVGIFADNRTGYEAALSILGCILAGFVVVPINARYAREEIDHAIGLTELSVLIFDSRLAVELGEDADRFPSVRLLVEMVGGVAGSDAIAWGDLAATPLASSYRWPALGEDDVSEILFTSGSTARPKAAELTTSSGVYAGWACAAALDLGDTDILQSFFPVFTTAGIRCILFPAWSVGATAVLDVELDVSRIMARIAAERTSVYYAVPSFYVFLLEMFDPALHDLSSLRLVAAGGAALKPETTERLLAALPDVDVRQTYGGTEGGPGGTVLVGALARSKLGSAGVCWPHTELRIADDADRDVPTGETGEILLRSPGLFRGYLRDEGATREALRNGWLHTGDVGRLDEDGCLFIVDRKKDLVIRGGHNIGTVEVETVLQRHAKVSEAAVIGIPHPKLGEDVLAVIKTTDGLEISADELIDFCADKLADYKRPRKFVFLDEFPRTGMGKILKPVLRAQFGG